MTFTHWVRPPLPLTQMLKLITFSWVTGAALSKKLVATASSVEIPIILNSLIMAVVIETSLQTHAYFAMPCFGGAKKNAKSRPGLGTRKRMASHFCRYL